MYREKIGLSEVKVSHELSSRINTRRSDRSSEIDRETRADSKIEMRFSG